MLTLIKEIIAKSNDRDDFWARFISNQNIQSAVEIGVYRGDFAQHILTECSSIKEYFMLDPWRHLDQWNKPANTDNSTFDAFLEETLDKTNDFQNKRKILRGKTTEVIDEIQDNSLDYAYIDGDHTLKGISIDLITCWPKIKEDGFIGGDDFKPSIWQHHTDFEPTLVFPFAVYFAEAVNAKIYALPYAQFLIQKKSSGFEFIDLTNGKYEDTSLLRQLSIRHKITKKVKRKIIETFPRLHKRYQKSVGQI